MKSRGPVSGFTLIELLVVIAIIAILAAILFPVYVSAKRSAHQSSCVSNLKQLASAMHSYTNDWSGTFPMAHRGTYSYAYGGDDSEDVYWQKAIYGYASKKWQLFYCPALTPKQVDFGNKYPSASFCMYSSIGMNCALGFDVGPIPAAKLDSIRVPTKTVMLGDASAAANNNNPNYGNFWICPGSRDPVNPGGKYLGLNPWPDWCKRSWIDGVRHDGKVNIALVDGHVQTKSREWLLAPHADFPKKPDCSDAATDYTWWDKY